jgi:nicotinamidase-related amidase
MMRPWDGIVPEEELRRYEAAGFGRPTGFGERPALVVIDVQYRTTGTERRPYWEAIKEYKTSCGEAAWDALPNIARLVTAFRAHGLPILFPYVSPKESFDAGRLGAKVPTIMDVPAKGYAFPPEVAPKPGEVLIPKKHPSAFFGTPLASYLIERAVDTLVVTGCSTSGCVRGTVVDGFAYNYRVTVPYDAVYDRSPTAHAVNLFDMAYKYADVRPTEEILALL